MWVPVWGTGVKAQDFCSPKGPRLRSGGCLGLDSVPSQSGRSKAAHSQPIWRKTFDGLLLVAPRQPPQPGTPPSQLVFQVADSFLKLSQSLIFAVVLASSRQTSVQRLGLLSKVLLVAAWHPHCRENRVALGFFSPLAASHIICLCCETLRLVLRRQPNRVAIAGQGWLRAHSGGDSFS